jgi:hexokinase
MEGESWSPQHLTSSSLLPWLATNDMHGHDSLYQHYPGFEEHMREALRILLGEEVEEQVVMGLAKDGSGVGGARD